MVYPRIIIQKTIAIVEVTVFVPINANATVNATVKIAFNEV